MTKLPNWLNKLLGNGSELVLDSSVAVQKTPLKFIPRPPPQLDPLPPKITPGKYVVTIKSVQYKESTASSTPYLHIKFMESGIPSMMLVAMAYSSFLRKVTGHGQASMVITPDIATAWLVGRRISVQVGEREFGGRTYYDTRAI